MCCLLKLYAHIYMYCCRHCFGNKNVALAKTKTVSLLKSIIKAGRFINEKWNCVCWHNSILLFRPRFSPFQDLMKLARQDLITWSQGTLSLSLQNCSYNPIFAQGKHWQIGWGSMCTGYSALTLFLTFRPRSPYWEFAQWFFKQIAIFFR